MYENMHQQTTTLTKTKTRRGENATRPRELAKSSSFERKSRVVERFLANSLHLFVPIVRFHMISRLLIAGCNQTVGCQMKWAERCKVKEQVPKFGPRSFRTTCIIYSE
jgi:hypothetical protein